MKDFKVVALTEILILVMMGFFSLDFLPRNFGEFNRICVQTWPTDAKQLEICMQPYYREISLDKYALIASGVALISVPLYFLFKKKQAEK